MPSYIQRVSAQRSIVADHKMVLSGERTLEDCWEKMKERVPSFSGQLHTEAHEQYTREMFALFSEINGREDYDELDNYDRLVAMGVWTYIEDLVFDEDTKIASWNMVEYFKDEDTKEIADGIVNASNSFDRQIRVLPENETTKSVDFHRPYID